MNSPALGATPLDQTAVRRVTGLTDWWRDDRGEPVRRNLGLVVVLIALLGIGAWTRPDIFLDGDRLGPNLFSILKQASAIGVVTVGMTFVIIGGGIDLSVGGLIALAGVWSTTLATQGFGAGGIVFTALVVGLGAGLVNGVLVAYGRLVPFIATLATFVAARGLAARISGKQTQTVDVAAINDLATARYLGIPLLIWILAAVVLLGWGLLNRTTFGRRTVALGGNAEAARLAGIRIRPHTVLLYGVSGLCCGIAALMLTAQATSAQAAMADMYELDAIAAAIIGGTLLTGGRGTIVGSLLGVLVFSTITNLFAVNNLPTEVQNMVKGGIIVAAVLVQQFPFGRLRRRKPTS
ncbi:ABC transporter [Longispora fulva]|uniref:Ribose transport system permease protein n=1 Tax=Longispora fulva TaxID=619741 RepID=A0A8J7KGA9_9ACTN|nr:ABC transporter permease [Longispora fulva]MBG6134764.1 ribose transport system permease protein [Longispora fulva]GIG61975.1 ABC transporter [Longispora fulva]